MIVHRPMRPKVVLAAALFSGLLTAGCQAPPQAPPPAPAPQVAVVTVQSQQVLLTTELPGRTSAYRTAEIRPQVSGLIQKRLFKEGADVQGGEVLYQIDPAPFQAALKNAQAALGRSQANLPAVRSRLGRYQELLADKAVSQQEYDDAASALLQTEADIAYGKASVETARINLAYTRITAPISGRIGRSNITEGAIVTAYQPQALATIQQLDPIYVDVPQSTSELLRLKQRLAGGLLNQDDSNQQKVTLRLEDGAPYPLEGTLQFKGVTVDASTGSVIIRAIFPNPNSFLLPNMFVRAVMKEGVDEKALMIPQQAVARDPKGNPVALIVDAEDKVRQRQLTVDRAIGDQWLVASGLAPGDRVIVEGRQKVRPGASVRTVPYESGTQKGPATSTHGGQTTPSAN
jgi:membrane fusion protein, multidrug efflux system